MKRTIVAGMTTALCAALGLPAVAQQGQSGQGAEQHGQLGQSHKPDMKTKRQGGSEGDQQRHAEEQAKGTQKAQGDQNGQKAEQGNGTASAQPGGAPPAVALSRATEMSRTALTNIQSAIKSLNSKDEKAAQQALDQAAGTLRNLYVAVPGGPILSHLAANEPGQPMNIAPVLAEIQSRSVWMDPDVVAKVKKADEQAKSGEQQKAQQSLIEARERMTADIALLPIEDAYARVQAARGELRDGHPDAAVRLLRNVPLAIEHVQATAPLVPVRFNLRAAAAAADEGNWQRAQQLVDDARQRLEQLAADSAISPDADKQLKAVVNRTQKLDQRLDQGKHPKPKELRDLAKQTRSVAKTL
jgi:hypothetical protein